MKIVDEFIQRIASNGVMLSLGDGIVDTFVSACLSEEKWITIGGKPKGDKKHVGGFKVKIDGKGNIVKGRMKGTNVKDVKKKFDERKDKGRKIKPEEKSQLPNFMKNIPSKSSNTLDLPGNGDSIPSTAANETAKASESKGKVMDVRIVNEDEMEAAENEELLAAHKMAQEILVEAGMPIAPVLKRTDDEVGKHGTDASVHVLIRPVVGSEKEAERMRKGLSTAESRKVEFLKKYRDLYEKTHFHKWASK